MSGAHDDATKSDARPRALAMPTNTGIRHSGIDSTADSRANSDAAQCSQLTESLARKHAQKHTLFVTFTNAASSAFAVNWALQLGAIKLSGVVERLPAAHAS